MRKTKLGNKGFSLVELIIVIAIMAVLIGILAPMFIRYVETSRIQTDVTTVDQIAKALQTAVMDPAVGTVVNQTAIWTANTGAVTAGTLDANVISAMAATLGTFSGTGIGSAARKSAACADAVLSIEVNASTGAIRITATTTGAGSRWADFVTGIEDVDSTGSIAD
ncbi:MAG: prepilin-type N-terminal cleavage/methylation domain-containing protein [Oscillospiraceae bacterium]|jgi:type IV pilus assembly protein PilA|nr:prepilin-type N-terminal cleavage/methylation domain-containing protein [Oscillospiraceae bacterium]